MLLAICSLIGLFIVFVVAIASEEWSLDLYRAPFCRRQVSRVGIVAIVVAIVKRARSAASRAMCRFRFRCILS